MSKKLDSNISYKEFFLLFYFVFTINLKVIRDIIII
jgi:hypothetical protein